MNNYQRFFLRFILAFSLLFAFFGCTKEDDSPIGPNDLHEVVFHAGWAPETKTVLQSDGSVWWSPGDEISLFTGSNQTGGYKLTSTNTEPAATVDFVGEIGDGNDFYAIYPYNDLNSFDGTYYVVYFADQVALEGTFAKNALKSIAHSSDNKLFFKNLCGGIKISVANEGISQITIHADTPIGGELKFLINEQGEPEYSGICSYPLYDLVFSAPNGGSFEPNKNYYIVLPSVSIPNGLRITFNKEDSYAEWSYTNPVEIHRSVFKRLECVDKDLVFYKKYDNAAVLYSFLPDEIGRESITGIEFHVKDATETEHQLSASVPVYYDVDGTNVNIYTAAEIFDISGITAYMFYGYSALKTLDLSNTITPNCESFGDMFRECKSLESIQFGDWDTKKVQSFGSMFSFCDKLQSLDLSFMNTGSAKNMSLMFFYCRSLESLNIDSFNTSQVTDMSDMFFGCRKIKQINLSSFNTSNVTNMCGMFGSCNGLLSLDLNSFNTTKVTDMGVMFSDCLMLKSLDLSSFDTKNVIRMHGMFSGCYSLKSINLSSFETSGVEDFSSMFYDVGFETLDLSNFQTSSAKNMTFMFGWSRTLKELDISSFTSESLQTAELMFCMCTRLQKLNLGALDLSNCDCTQAGSFLMQVSKSGAIRCLPETRSKLEESIDPTWLGDITWLTLSDDINSFSYIRNTDLYYSSDFSKHETVKKLYSATKGKGIDIVLMGDAYSDRMIADGRYDADMELAANAIFSKEPMASFKDMFNVYIVYLVSDNEVLGESTALDGVASGSGYLQGYASACVPANYRILATGNGDLSVQEAIVIVNNSLCEESWPSGYAELTWTPDLMGDYGVGYSAVVVGRGDASLSDEFQLTVAHEFGHSFAKLADEYWTYNNQIEDVGAILGVASSGWYRNVDVVSDPLSIKWSHLLSDERYSNDGVGIFEGGFEYLKGVWRPSENSIMRYGTKFNAPSREAIYYRIHKLAYGEDWQYDYETFVQQDMKNISSGSQMHSSAKNIPYPARVNKKHIFKMEESTDKDGRKMVTVIMD